MITKDDLILITGASGFIGTNLIELFEEKGYSFVNYDKADVTKKDQRKYWHEGNIMNKEQLVEAFNKYKPTIVIHLAARTDTASPKLEDYIENTEGSANVLEAVKNCPSVKRCIMTSTQYVYKSLSIPFPSRDDEYIPHTAYGKSKMIMEENVRHSDLSCEWTIVRPANVWGPWHMRYPNQLLRFMDKGLYFHPIKKPAVRTYAYVKNLCHQIDGIINAETKIVDRKTFYLGDLPIDSRVWLEEWVKQLRGTKLHYIPSWMMKCAALFGDILMKFGINFPMHTTRYNNMMEDWYDTTDMTIALFGVRNPSLADNVKENIAWLEGDGAEMFEYWKKRKKKQ